MPTEPYRISPGPILLFLVAAACAPLAASPVDSTISAVTVYSDRAVVTRTVSYSVSQPGTVVLDIDKLPASLLDGSLQVSAAGTAQVTLLDVTPREVHVDHAPNERVKALEDDIRQLRGQSGVLDDRATVLKEQNASLTSIEHAATQSPSKDAPRLNLEDAAKLLAFMEEQRGKISSEERSIAGQKADLAAKQAAAERQLSDLAGGGARSYKSVAIRLQAETSGTLNVALSYAVGGASWSASYDARADGTGSSLSLGYFGIVRQDTGEDWRDVRLTLSTARPSAGGSPAALEGWTIDVMQPPRPVGGEEEPTVLSPFEVASSAPFAKSAPRTTAGTRVVTSQYLQARVSNQVTSASFDIQVAATVPSDNSPQKVPISTVKLAAAPEFLAIPKEVLAAFLTDKVTNTSDFPFIAGPMNVFLDNAFVASSAIDTVMPGEKFDLALGADEAISVKRRLNNRFTENMGIVSKSTRVTYDFTITVQNNKKAAARVMLVDQVPVSRNEKIVVAVDTPKEDEAKRDADGTLRWTLDLRSGEKREVPLRFSVEYPSDLQVVGLE